MRIDRHKKKILAFVAVVAVACNPVAAPVPGAPNCPMMPANSNESATSGKCRSGMNFGVM